jgi:hypothetical protein
MQLRAAWQFQPQWLPQFLFAAAVAFLIESHQAPNFLIYAIAGHREYTLY